MTSFQRFQYSNRLCHQRIAISRRACAHNYSQQFAGVGDACHLSVSHCPDVDKVGMLLI
jgi:hypothetical protein